MVELVIDRIVLRADQRSRLADSLELAFSEGDDRAIICIQDPGAEEWRELAPSNRLACVICGTVHDALSPRHFSWNHAEGACGSCGGFGRLTVPARTVGAGSRQVGAAGATFWRLGSKQMIIRRNALLKQLAEQLPFDPTVPWEELEPAIREQILQGTGERLFAFKLKGGNSRPEMLPYPAYSKIWRRPVAARPATVCARLMAFQTSSSCADATAAVCVRRACRS